MKTIEGIISSVSFKPGPDKLFDIRLLTKKKPDGSWEESEGFILSADEDDSRIVAPNGAQTNRYNLMSDLAALDVPVKAVLHPSKERYGLVLKAEFYASCSNCGGTGKYYPIDREGDAPEKDCPTCGGKGWMVNT